MKLWLKNTFYFWPGLLEMIIIYHGSHLQPRRDKALSSIVYSLFEKWFWRVYLRFQRLCNTDGKIFHRHWKIVAYWMVLLFVWLEKLRDIPICFRRITCITSRKPIPRTEHVTWVRWIMNFWSNQQEWKEKLLLRCKMCHKMCHKRTMQSLESIFLQSY